MNKLWRDSPEVPLAQDVVKGQADTEKQSCHILLISKEARQGLGNLVEIQNFSSFSRLVNTLTCVFCSILQRRPAPTDERKYAELLLIKEAQFCLKTDKNFPMWGILNPVILPGDHHLTTLYIRRAHARVLHNGVKETLSELRSQLWVIKGRSVVKHVLHN